jgi:hypothetical protein
MIVSGGNEQRQPGFLGSRRLMMASTAPSCGLR